MKMPTPGSCAPLFFLAVVSSVGSLTCPLQAQDRIERIVMRDGTVSQANIWFPTEHGEGPWPVVLKRFYAARQFGFGRDQFLAAGYVTIHAEVRDADGSIGTRGTLGDLDGYDSVEWIAQQPWCNGDVIMYGVSGGGQTTLAAASARPPHLKAIMPMAFGDPWRWWYRAHGAVTLAMSAKTRAINANEPPWNEDRDAFKFLPLLELDLHATGKVSPLWRKIVSNNEWNAHYSGKRHKIEQIEIPTFIICGWWDYHIPTVFRYWSTIRELNPSKDVRLVIEATNHGGGHRLPPDGRHHNYVGGTVDSSLEAIRWLDYVLKGRRNGVQDEPPLRVFTMVANKWQNFSDWPPPAAQKRNFYLQPTSRERFGELRETPPGRALPSRYVYDPDNPVPTLGCNSSFHHKFVPTGSYDHSEHERRSDVLVFSTPPLTEDTEVTGPVEVNFWAASDARDTDWTAVLLDVEPDGKPYNVTMGIVRARYRKDIFKAPELLTPGAIEAYRLDLMPTSYLFRKGHRIRLYISSSNFPLWDRNPNTGGEIHLETRTQVARQTVYHDAERPSHLTLHVMPAARPGNVSAR